MNKALFHHVSKQLQRRDEIPLFGSAPPLNLSELSLALSKQFGISDLQIQIKKQEWIERVSSETNQTETPIHVSPFDTPLYWIMTKKDREKLLSQMMFQKQKKAYLSSTALQEGFYEFILLETLNGAQSLEPISEMSLQLGSGGTPDEAGVMITVEISIGTLSTWGKLFITDTFRKTWVQHFAAFPPQYIPNNFSKQMKLELGIQAGSVQLPIKEWKKLKAGDLILPDTFQRDRYALVLNEVSLFELKQINPTQLTITASTCKKESMEDNTLNDEQQPQEQPVQTDPASLTVERAEMEEKKITQVPLNVSIELARVKLTLDELMKLTPGNLLEIPELSEKAVSLIANGQKIGVAEIVELEDTIGLKILEI